MYLNLLILFSDVDVLFKIRNQVLLLMVPWGRYGFFIHRHNNTNSHHHNHYVLFRSVSLLKFRYYSCCSLRKHLFKEDSLGILLFTKHCNRFIAKRFTNRAQRWSFENRHCLTINWTARFSRRCGLLLIFSLKIQLK